MAQQGPRLPGARSEGAGEQAGHGARVEQASPDERLVGTAIYVDGRRARSPESLAETSRALADEDGAMAWVGLYRPSAEELQAAAEEFGLHELAVEDAILAHQRPKVERYDETLFVVLRPARYLDETEQVELGELHLFIGPDFVLTVRHGRSPDLAAVRDRMEAAPELLRRGPHAVLYAVLDAVVDDYAPVVEGVQHDIDEIETQVFGGDPNASRRTYQLSREVIELQRATSPLLGILEEVGANYAERDADAELHRRLRDVTDHATTVAERVGGFRQMISDILSVNATLVTQEQNEKMKSLTEASYAQSEQVKSISSWAAILFAPTLVGTVYGMNFDAMPELHWSFGYPMAVGLMIVVCVLLYVVFKRRDWL
ncbi:MAG: magnesium and cobalt transport protein CorA [Saccharopolyspora sp.]|uniref:magnesium and cobalt transport protein CorA n=1 Tax=Saccharopolyspora sp. TaxID=33915 RepID=UPI0025F6CB79|nr:magnesium and cobalt transport protein CorA [Saccharopolyspora sp.]MBQ6643322.1 magnesium and cobalt transport protein CorA [Saccharopolyspora sp.]